MIHPDLYLQFQVVLNIAGRKKKKTMKTETSHTIQVVQISFWFLKQLPGHPMDLFFKISVL